MAARPSLPSNMSPWPLLLAAAFGSHRPALSARLSASCAHLPDAPPRAARANDNRATAGTLTSGVLTIRLVAQRAAWRPDGPTGCALGVHAFAEEGKPVTVPGPLIRVV